MLNPCPECAQPCSDKARVCPHCGHPLSPPDKTLLQHVTDVGTACVLAALVLGLPQMSLPGALALLFNPTKASDAVFTVLRDESVRTAPLTISIFLSVCLLYHRRHRKTEGYWYLWMIGLFLIAPVIGVFLGAPRVETLGTMDAFSPRCSHYDKNDGNWPHWCDYRALPFTMTLEYLSYYGWSGTLSAIVLSAFYSWLWIRRVWPALQNSPMTLRARLHRLLPELFR